MSFVEVSENFWQIKHQWCLNAAERHCCNSQKLINWLRNGASLISGTQKICLSIWKLKKLELIRMFILKMSILSQTNVVILFKKKKLICNFLFHKVLLISVEFSTWQSAFTEQLKRAFQKYLLFLGPWEKIGAFLKKRKKLDNI